ncbi:MAG TPA: heavy metal-binding domain-containing protein, partial [Lysobacter sp.]|nr:heavy metal-binding domain-containing protein [Lysobacter sp.]
MSAHPHDHHHDAAAAGPRAVDPVCGMQVDPATTPHHAQHEGREYAFCSAGCRQKFIAQPQRYVQAQPSPSEAAPVPSAPPGTIYTCPMHPQIRQTGPGICPICGMALEPELPSLEDDDNPELSD